MNFVRVVGVWMLSAIVTAPVCAHAATRTWQGTGANPFWSTPDNWELNQVPGDGDDLVFPETAPQPSSTNDLPNLLVRSFTIASTRTFTGNSIRLQVSIRATASSGGTKVTFDLPIELTSEVELFPDVAASLRFAGVISGAGGIVFHGGPVTLARTNTYAGTTRMPVPAFAIQQIPGELIVEAEEAIPNAPSLELREPAGLTIRNHRQTLAGLGGGPDTFVTFDSTANPSELVLNGAAMTVFAGELSGSGLIRHTGTGTQIIGGQSPTLTGSIVVERGTVQIASAGVIPVPIDVSANGRLELQGSTGAVSSNDGDVLVELTQPRTAGLTLVNGTFRAAGNNPGVHLPSLGRVTVSGPVSLGNAALSLDLDDRFAPPQDAQFVLVDKTSPGPVLGAFLGFPEGATVAVNGYEFRISYVGGDGNDIVLTTTKGAREYLLSEGATSGFFTTDILIANPHDQTVPTTVTFFQTGFPRIVQYRDLAPRSRTTIRVNQIDSLAAAEFSTQVKSNKGEPLIVERTMTWDGATAYGAHTEHATEELSKTWYFAEGSQGFFLTYLLLANPENLHNVATVQYLRTAEPPIERTYRLDPFSRRTVDISQKDFNVMEADKGYFPKFLKS